VLKCKKCEEVSYEKDGSTFVGLLISQQTNIIYILTDTEWLIKESFSLERIKNIYKKT
jgi:hypothetical protein